LGATGAQNLEFSIDIDSRPYNSYAPPCHTVVNANKWLCFSC